MARPSLLGKALALTKMVRYRNSMQRGERGLQLVELNFSNRCNFSCQHCFSRDFPPTQAPLTLEEVRNLADQAHELGVWQWHLQGGEPLSWPELDGVIDAIGPERFHLFITTNGWLMTAERARALAERGVDKISVSLDSLIPEEHDLFRGMPGAYARALQALNHAHEAGMQANINVCVTRENVRTQRLLDIVEYAKAHNFSVLFVIAAPVGAWAGRTDLLITEEDGRYLLELKKAYPFIHRDLYPLFNFEWGCRTRHGLVYVTPNGDLLPCPFIHVTLGNLRQQSLAELLNKRDRIHWFHDFNPKCLVGEDQEFITKVIPRIHAEGPIAPAELIFPELLENG